MAELTNLQNKVFEIVNPVEIDAAVEKMRQAFSNLSWLSHPYHIAQRFYKETEKGAFYYPETYISKADGDIKKEPYHRLTPDSDYTGMIFFMVGKSTPGSKGNDFTNYPVSIIGSANLKKIDPVKLKKYLFTQELIKSIKDIIYNNEESVWDFSVEIISETRDLRETYREFVLDKIESYNRAPLQCFRIDLLVTLQKECS